MKETQKQKHSWKELCMGEQGQVGANMGDKLQRQMGAIHGGSCISGETDLNSVGSREPLEVYELWRDRL